MLKILCPEKTKQEILSDLWNKTNQLTKWWWSEWGNTCQLIYWRTVNFCLRMSAVVQTTKQRREVSNKRQSECSSGMQRTLFPQNQKWCMLWRRSMHYSACLMASLTVSGLFLGTDPLWLEEPVVTLINKEQLKPSKENASMISVHRNLVFIDRN